MGSTPASVWLILTLKTNRGDDLKFVTHSSNGDVNLSFRLQTRLKKNEKCDRKTKVIHITSDSKTALAASRYVDVITLDAYICHRSSNINFPVEEFRN